MTTTTGKKPVGFALLSPEQRREMSRRGGKAVPKEKRQFFVNRDLASRAGVEGAEAVHELRRQGKVAPPTRGARGRIAKPAAPELLPPTQPLPGEILHRQVRTEPARPWLRDRAIEPAGGGYYRHAGDLVPGPGVVITTTGELPFAHPHGWPYQDPAVTIGGLREEPPGFEPGEVATDEQLEEWAEKVLNRSPVDDRRRRRFRLCDPAGPDPRRNALCGRIALLLLLVVAVASLTAAFLAQLQGA